MNCPHCGAELPPVTDPTAREVSCPACGESTDLAMDSSKTRVVSPATIQAALEDPLVGKTLGEGRYRIESRLGRGGMGTVYRGTQVSLGREVAIKVLAEDLARDESFIRRFRREAGALAAFQHANIVTVYDTGEDDGTHFIVMAYVTGPGGESYSLRRLMDAGPLDPDLALRIASQMCAGLGYAHEQGIVHRDIKPGNILLDERWNAQVADFGIARVAASGEETALTVVGSAMGTLSYMAPEQRLDASTADARADVYSLGVVFYEMLTAQVPEGRFELPTQIRGGLSVPVDGIVERSLRPRPDQRYANASEMLQAIEALRGARSASRPMPTPPPAVPAPAPTPLPVVPSPTPAPTVKPPPVPAPPLAPAPTPLPMAPPPAPAPPPTPAPPPPPAPARSTPPPPRMPGDEPPTPTPPPPAPSVASAVVGAETSAIPKTTGILGLVAAGTCALGAAGGFFAFWALCWPRSLGLSRWRSVWIDSSSYHEEGYWFDYRTTNDDAQLAIILIGLAVLVAAGVLFAIWFHRAWRDLPAGQRPMRASVAAGRLFLPGYNAWWLFRILPTYTRGLDQACRAAGTTPGVNLLAVPLALAAGAGAIVPGLGPLLLGAWLLLVERSRKGLVAAPA